MTQTLNPKDFDWVRFRFCHSYKTLS